LPVVLPEEEIKIKEIGELVEAVELPEGGVKTKKILKQSTEAKTKTKRKV